MVLATHVLKRIDGMSRREAEEWLSYVKQAAAEVSKINQGWVADAESLARRKVG
jgi:hypothetical protein